MCPPTFLPALRGERSWLADRPPLDTGRADEQWARLRELIDRHIGEVVGLPPAAWARGMTFTRDLAVVVADTVVPLMPTSVRGPFEAPLFARCLRQLGIEPVQQAQTVRFDGGNVLVVGDGRLLVGVPPGGSASVVEPVRRLEELTGLPAYGLPLEGGRFPHIDMAVCDLAGRAWLVYPRVLPGFDLDEPAWADILGDRPVIAADPVDGEQLACNLVVATDVAIGPPISAALQTQIEATGLGYLATPLEELNKAGGGAHCLTLELPG